MSEERKVDIGDHKECYIVGGGPSLTAFDWSNLDDKFVIGINRAYEKKPDLDIIYFTDPDWYDRHKDDILKLPAAKYRGRLQRKPEIVHPDVYEIQLVGEVGWSDKWGELYHGINSTYAAIQVAYQLGFKKINLLGIDMKWRGRRTHWHSGHKRIDPEAIFTRMGANLCALAPEAKKRGVEIVNINIDTALTCFPVRTFAQAFPKDGEIVESPAPVNEIGITVMKEGTGPALRHGQRAVVHYTGWLHDESKSDGRGAKFDSSVDRGQPFVFPLGNGHVIKGWEQGLVGMKVGEVRELIIPPELAYGDRHQPGIPPKSTLVFRVQRLLG